MAKEPRIKALDAALQCVNYLKAAGVKGAALKQAQDLAIEIAANVVASEDLV